MKTITVTITDRSHLDTLARVKRLATDKPVGTILLELVAEHLDTTENHDEMADLLADLAGCEALIEQLEQSNAALELERDTLILGVTALSDDLDSNAKHIEVIESENARLTQELAATLESRTDLEEVEVRRGPRRILRALWRAIP